MPAFATGALAIGIVSGAYQAEVFRGAYHGARPRRDRGRAIGRHAHAWLLFRRIIAPQVLRYAIPGLGNIWQLVLKESALISVTGLVELLRQSQIGAGSTAEPFDFYITAGDALPRHHQGFDLAASSAPRTYSMRGMRRAS